MNKLVLIDGNAIIHRAYHSMPKTLSTRKGELTNAVYGFTITLIKVLEDLKPEFMACSFDLAGPTFRHKAYKEYKATRVKADQELYDQIPRVKELVGAMGIPVYELQGYEADDVIGTITKKLTAYSLQLTAFIVSGDKDIFQLVDDNVKVYNLKKGLSQTQIIDSDVIQKEYNLQPSDFIDLKALAGDASDNIPGVPGIGPKTATQLLQTYDTLENLYAIIEKFQDTRDNNQTNSNNQNPNNQTKPAVIPAEAGIQNGIKSNFTTTNWIPDQVRNDKQPKIKPRILDLLIKHKEQAFLSQHLATIDQDVPIDFNLEKCRFGGYDKEKLRALFEELGFQSLLWRFGNSHGTKEPKNERTKKPFDSAQGKQKTQIQKKDQQLKLL